MRKKTGIAATKNKNLTQGRLCPISPFSYVGQGRKGAKRKERQIPREPHRFPMLVVQRTQKKEIQVVAATIYLNSHDSHENLLKASSR
jgi:hypothetical protein